MLCNKKKESYTDEMKMKWYRYLLGLEPPCRLLLPAFSSPSSSWWRTVTWLPLGCEGRGRKVTGDSVHQYKHLNHMTRHQRKTAWLHRLVNIKNPHHAQRRTEARRIYWGSEKGKVSTTPLNNLGLLNANHMVFRHGKQLCQESRNQYVRNCPSGPKGHRQRTRCCDSKHVKRWRKEHSRRLTPRCQWTQNI